MFLIWTLFSRKTNSKLEFARFVQAAQLQMKQENKTCLTDDVNSAANSGFGSDGEDSTLDTITRYAKIKIANVACLENKTRNYNMYSIKFGFGIQSL